MKKVGWDAGWLNTKVNRSIDCIGDLLLSVAWDCPVTSFIPRDEGQRTTVDGPRGSGGLARVGSVAHRHLYTSLLNGVRVTDRQSLTKFMVNQ